MNTNHMVVLKTGEVFGKARKTYGCSLGWCGSDSFNQTTLATPECPGVEKERE